MEEQQNVKEKIKREAIYAIIGAFVFATATISTNIVWQITGSVQAEYAFQAIVYISFFGLIVVVIITSIRIIPSILQAFEKKKQE